MLALSALQPKLYCQEANLLPNPSFESGQQAPEGWKLAGGKGEWETTAALGARAVSVTGNGDDSSDWRCPVPAAVQPGKTYRVSFMARRGIEGATNGSVISGLSLVNRDFSPPDAWARKSFVFAAPKNLQGAVVRFGQWHVKGKVLFDDVALTEVAPIHAKQDDIILGAGESIRDKTYAFEPQFGYEGSNYSRCLLEATASFNSDRWSFGPGQYIIYKHEVGVVSQRNAELKVAMNYHTAGACVVECGADGRQWRALGRIENLGEQSFALPKDLFPARTIYVRLRSPQKNETPQDQAGGAFQINQYRYAAELESPQPGGTGATRFLDIRRQSKELDVSVKSLGDLRPGEGNAVSLALRNTGAKKSAAVCTLMIEDAAGQVCHSYQIKTPVLAPNESADVSLPYQIQKSGEFTLRIRVAAASDPSDRSDAFDNSKDIYEATCSFAVPSLYDASYGYYLGDNPETDWWWCEGTYKISRERPAPKLLKTAPLASAVRLEAARGEYEPAQIVLRPKRALEDVKVSVTAEDARWTSAVQTFWVAYHYVQRPTDASGCVGWWPDALPPCAEPVTLKENQNHPIWLLVKVPNDCPAGDHKLQLKIEGRGFAAITVPVVVRVFNFSLPAKPSLESGFGLSPQNIKRYHNLATLAEERQVWDLYMQNFREHRMAPYDFAPFDPIKSEYAGAAWEGGAIVEEQAPEGKRYLKIVDDNPKAQPGAVSKQFISIEPGAEYIVSWRVKTGKAGQKYLVALNLYDRDRRWISGHNAHFEREGKGEWERAEATIVPSRQTPNAAFMIVHLYPTEWKDSGEPIGTAWFDDISVVKKTALSGANPGAKPGANLLADGGFEADESQLKAVVDTAAWEQQAKKYLDEYGFPSFMLRLSGMGGGTYESRRAGRIGPYEQGTPGYRAAFRDHCQQLERMLERNGWLGKEYIYWFDEPDPKDYEFVKAGMEEIKLAAPRLRRMLTEEPIAPLFGAVDIWCPVLHNYDVALCQARQKKGERIWWYVCCGPHAPYPALFIDHGAIDLRMWLWMTWKWNVQGILIWETNYWTSPAKFKGVAPQNPWDDPMGYTASEPVGYWGNGDGRMLYPPNRNGAADKRKYLAPPVSSIRWEMLREGMEDYEYFHLLSEVVKKARAAGKRSPQLDEAEKHLTIPDKIISDKTNFTNDPKSLYERRRALAEAIEKMLQP
ncbi:MAG: DUF4091 domain-containing protein [Candidatus Sumerlaeota bacterium]|nr:DUF4091 domain-containing protein [Candidatus Sumerlaeota bacterium]